VNQFQESGFPNNQLWSDTYTNEHIWEDPRYRVGGRRTLFKLFPSRGRAGLITRRDVFIVVWIGIYLTNSLLFYLHSRYSRRDIFFDPYNEELLPLIR
jgi:hypothetical protein